MMFLQQTGAGEALGGGAAQDKDSQRPGACTGNLHHDVILRDTLYRGLLAVTSDEFLPTK